VPRTQHEFGKAYKWRAKFGGMVASMMPSLKELEVLIVEVWQQLDLDKQ
jgi:hypothetical protein